MKTISSFLPTRYIQPDVELISALFKAQTRTEESTNPDKKKKQKCQVNLKLRNEKNVKTSAINNLNCNHFRGSKVKKKKKIKIF